MIKLEEIQEGEIIKVLVNNDDIEEELFARVYKNTGNIVIVKYLSPTEKNWKGSCVYELEEENNTVEPESVTNHYIGCILFDEVEGIAKIPRTPYYYYEIEKNPDASEDDDDDDDEDEDGYEIDDEFCVDDGEIDGRLETAQDWRPPPNSKNIDCEWNEWTPQTDGARRFKERVDMIESLARNHLDNLEFASK